MTMGDWGHLWSRPSEENERLQASTSQKVTETWSSLRRPLNHRCNSPISLEMKRWRICPLYSTMNSFWSVCFDLIWKYKIARFNLFINIRHCCHHTLTSPLPSLSSQSFQNTSNCFCLIRYSHHQSWHWPLSSLTFKLSSWWFTQHECGKWVFNTLHS